MLGMELCPSCRHASVRFRIWQAGFCQFAHVRSRFMDCHSEDSKFNSLTNRETHAVGLLFIANALTTKFAHVLKPHGKHLRQLAVPLLVGQSVDMRSRLASIPSVPSLRRLLWSCPVCVCVFAQLHERDMTLSLWQGSYNRAYCGLVLAEMCCWQIMTAFVFGVRSTGQRQSLPHHRPEPRPSKECSNGCRGQET